MKLPNGNRAIIDVRKNANYCLSSDHDDGKHKARLFREILGITDADTDMLVQQLRAAAADGEAIAATADRYGQRFIVAFVTVHTPESLQSNSNGKRSQDFTTETRRARSICRVPAVW